MTRYLTNPLFAFVMVWTVAVASYLLGVFSGLFPMAGFATIMAVLLNVLTFCLGYLTWSLVRNLKPPAAPSSLPPARPLNSGRIAAALKFTLLMGLVALSLGLYRIAAVASYFGSGFFHLLTHPETMRLQLVLFIGTNIFEVNYTAMLISVAGSFFSLGFVLLGLFLYMSSSVTRYFYLGAFLLVSLATGLTNLSRFEVTVHVLYLILSYCFLCSLGGARKLRHALINIVLPFAVAALLFVVIEVLLHKSAAYAQPDRFRRFLFSLYWSVASPLVAFNEFISSFDGHYRLGQNMFFPFYKWLCRLDLAPETELSVYGEMIFVPYAANVYTYLRTVYGDFGMAGVIVVPYALGWATSALGPKASRHFHYLNLYLVLLVFILFSFYNYSLISNQVYMQVLFGFLFFRYELNGLYETRS